MSALKEHDHDHTCVLVECRQTFFEICHLIIYSLFASGLVWFGFPLSLLAGVVRLVIPARVPAPVEA